MYQIVSFNLRYDTPRDGAQQFPNRLPFILETIRREAPDVIGFQEALQHMRHGAKARLILPSHLAYGSIGDGADIPGFATLVYNIEIIE